MHYLLSFRGTSLPDSTSPTSTKVSCGWTATLYIHGVGFCRSTIHSISRKPWYLQSVDMSLYLLRCSHHSISEVLQKVCVREGNPLEDNLRLWPDVQVCCQGFAIDPEAAWCSAILGLQSDSVDIQCWESTMVGRSLRAPGKV